MLLTKVAKMDIPIAQAGNLPPPVVNSLAVLFRKENEIPNPTIPNMYMRKIERSRIGMSGMGNGAEILRLNLLNYRVQNLFFYGLKLAKKHIFFGFGISVQRRGQDSLAKSLKGKRSFESLEVGGLIGLILVEVFT